MIINLTVKTLRIRVAEIKIINREDLRLSARKINQTLGRVLARYHESNRNREIIAKRYSAINIDTLKRNFSVCLN